MSPDHLGNRGAKSDRSQHLPGWGGPQKRVLAALHSSLEGSGGGRTLGVPMTAFTPWALGGCTCPAQGLQARTCRSAGAKGGKPRGVSPGAAATFASSLPATDQASCPLRPAPARTSSSPGREGTGRNVTPGRAPRGHKSQGAGTHPLGDGAAPGALPLLPRVDDLLDADGLALLAVPARGWASAPLAPTMLTSPPLTLMGPLVSPHSL